MERPSKQELFTLLFALIGALMNLAPAPLFFGVDFLFGGIVALAPAILYGPLHGFVAAGLAALPTLQLWGHPYALMTFSLEGLVVGWWVRRQTDRVVSAELGYWLLVGGPLVAGLYTYLLGLDPAATYMIAVKQGLNALVNAILCSTWLMVTGIEPLISPGARRAWPMRRILIAMSTFGLLLPVITSTVWFGRWAFRRTQDEALRHTGEVGQLLESRLETWTSNRLAAMEALAGQASSTMNNPKRLQRWLELYHLALPEFHNLYIADRRGITIAFDPLVGVDGRSTLGISFADRSYHVQVQHATSAFATPVFYGRGGTDAAISVLVAPIRQSDGELQGYAVAAADLSKLQGQISGGTQVQHSIALVADSRGQIIYSSAPQWQALDPWQPAELGEVQPLSEQLHRILAPGSSAIARWQGGYYMWQSQEPRTGWATVILFPLRPAVDALFLTYTFIMGAALLFMAPVVVISRWVASLVTTPLEELAAAATGSTGGGDLATAFHPPRHNRVLEVETLATALNAAMARIQGLNANLEERIQQRTQELAAANRELESFVYSVSHDLRAPLRAIRGFTRAAIEHSRHQLDATAYGYLERVQAAEERMGAMIEDLLALSRVSRSDLDCQFVDLSEIARAIGSELQQNEPDRQVQLIVTPGAVAWGDSALLYLVLQNLLQNAWKFTLHHATALIEFGTAPREGDPVYYVRDDGAGFDMAQIERLFVPFQRLHSGLEFPGHGIGLATVQRIIHRHGGQVWAEGAVEQGATFYFSLPQPETTEVEST